MSPEKIKEKKSREHFVEALTTPELNHSLLREKREWEKRSSKGKRVNVFTGSVGVRYPIIPSMRTALYNL